MKKDTTYNVVMTGMMMCIILVGTMLIRIPVPATGGYVHLGDTAIFIAVLLLGRNKGALAAGVGSALADLLSGYAFYAPWTLVIKAFMGFVTGAALEHMRKKGKLEDSIAHHKLAALELGAMTLGGCVMVAGYYLAESIMAGNFTAPLAAIPPNIGQFAVGMVLALILAAALYHTPAKKYFAILGKTH